MEEDRTTLVPIQERAVDFYGDQVLAVLVDVAGEQQVYVPLRPICEYLGLDWSSQLKRIRRDAVMRKSLQGVVILTTPQGGRQEMQCLPLKFLPGWLFGVTPSKVRPELRDKVIRYQEECFDVLWRAFQSEALARQPGSPAMATLAHVREMGLAIAALAEQQMAQEARLAAHDDRLDRAAEVVRNLSGRLSTVERKLAAGPVTEEQAAEISARVKALAEHLSSREPGKVHYQAIFGELYRQFGVTSYKAIPLDRFDEVMQFLEDWRRAAGE